MLKARMDYGAVSAKVLAMYGRLLSREDWKRLEECQSVPDIVSLLKAHRGWSPYLAELSAVTTPDRLIKAVRGRQGQEFSRLYSFASLQDKEFLRSSLTRAEYDAILLALRSIYSGKEEAPLWELPEFVRKHSRLDLEQLSAATDLGAIAQAAEQSVFAPVLKQAAFEKAGDRPPYSQVAAALENCYYKEAFSRIARDYSGPGKRKLQRLLGAQADMLNIVGILRLHRYFPASVANAGQLIVPISGALKSSLMDKLINAQSEEQAVEILRGTHFGKYFADYRPAGRAAPSEKTPGEPFGLDSLYSRAMESFCRQTVKMPAPNICVPVAYLSLSEMEQERLVRIIQSVSYGIRPAELQ